MKISIRDATGVIIACGDMTWTIDPQANGEYIAAFQQYSFPLADKHGTFLAQMEIVP